MYEDKKCWKCGRWMTSFREEGNYSLCKNCYSDLRDVIVSAIILGWYVLCYLLVPRVHYFLSLEVHQYVFIERLLAAMLLSMISAIILGAIATILLLVFTALGNIWQWIVAFVKHLQRSFEDRQKKAKEEDVKRGQLAEPTRLDGMQLDKLLTEEQLKKNGWN